MPDDFIPQQSAAWVRERVGCLTASRMKDAMAVLKNGKPAEARNKLLMEIVAERMADCAADHYVTAAMQWGIDNEPFAASAYENETGALLMPASFYRHPRIEHFGASPDRLLGDDGLVEIKCPSTPRYVEWRLAGVVPDEHKPQMIAQLACTGRRYVDFVAFDPRVVNGPRLFIRRYEPTAEEIAAVETAAVEFLAEADRMFSLVTGAN
jgi:putative phage-type endonuclease